MASYQRPAGVTALCIFFAFGTTMAALAAATVALPGTALDAIWRINPQGHAGLLALGGWSVALMVGVAALCGAAAAGLWIGARWGWNAALVVLSANLVGDMTNALVRGDRRTLIGVPIALALIAYVVRTRPARRPNPAVAGRT